MDLTDLFNLRFNEYDPGIWKILGFNKRNTPKYMNYSTYLFLEKYRGTSGLLRSLGSSYTANRISGIENIGSNAETVKSQRKKKFGSNVYS